MKKNVQYRKKSQLKTLRGTCTSNQHGPFIFCSKRNNSRLVESNPRTWLNVEPIRLDGKGGYLA